VLAVLANEKIWVSVPTAQETITDATTSRCLDSSRDNLGATATAAAGSAIDGTGWIPVKLSSLIGGSPIQICRLIRLIRSLPTEVLWKYELTVH